MQSLDVISINIWHMLISLCNLALLYLILKRFLYKPVENMLDRRREAIDGDYEKAARARETAEANRQRYEAAMAGARQEADALMRQTTQEAQMRGNQIMAEARDRADQTTRQAQRDIELDRRKAEADVRRSIVDVSAAMAEKVLGRELTPEDQQRLIDACIDDIGEDHDGRNA